MKVCRGVLKDIKTHHYLATKGVRCERTRECTIAFLELKRELTSAPDLRVLDMDKDFIVCKDASKQGLGVVLMQDKGVITYASRKL